MKVVIDTLSGCCNGVRMAIEKAEKLLSEGKELYSLGSIVHNGAEIDRLEKLGLRTVSYSDFKSLEGKRVLIRAHGEPPSTYAAAKENGIEIVDCTCPVVLALQRRISKAYKEISHSGGSVVIFGKRGHAEVNGLVGQTEGKAVVIGSKDEFLEKVRSGEIKKEAPVALFSQTTKDPIRFEEISKCAATVIEPENLYIHNTICRNVSSRHQSLTEFAGRCSLILFICGKESSNGKVLYDICRNVNSRAYKIEVPEEIDFSLIREDDVVGLCGAASTTRWQLERAAEYIREKMGD